MRVTELAKFQGPADPPQRLGRQELLPEPDLVHVTVPQPGPSSNRRVVVGETYTFVPAGLDLEEHPWVSEFFAAPGDTVVVKQHRPGSGSALLCRPDGTPCGTCLVASLVTVSDAAAVNARAVEQSRVRRAEEAERRRADATRHDLLDLYRAEVAARRPAIQGPAELHVKALRHRDALADALGAAPTRAPLEGGLPGPRGPDRGDAGVAVHAPPAPRGAGGGGARGRWGTGAGVGERPDGGSAMTASLLSWAAGPSPGFSTDSRLFGLAVCLRPHVLSAFRRMSRGEAMPSPVVPQ